MKKINFNYVNINIFSLKDNRNMNCIPDNRNSHTNASLAFSKFSNTITVTLAILNLRGILITNVMCYNVFELHFVITYFLLYPQYLT